MTDAKKTKQKLIEELQDLRRHVAEMEARERSRLSRTSAGKDSEMARRVKDVAIERAIYAIAFADLQGDLFYVNDSFLTLWGFDDEEDVLGKPAADFWDDEGQVWEVIQSIKSKGTWSGELRGRRKDGQRFYSQVSASLVAEDDGTPLCMMASFMDITARKEVEETLRESEEEYRKLFESTQDGVVISGPDGRIVRANLAAAAMVGFKSVQEIIGLRMTDWYADPTERDRLMAELMMRKSIKAVEIVFKKTDGTTGIGQVNLNLHQDERGQIERIDGIVRDVTEMKRREKELEESEEKYATLVNNIRDGIYSVDEKGYFTYVNGAIEERSGISREHFRKLRFIDLIKPEYRDRVWANFEKVMRGERVTPYELEYMTASDRALFVEVNTWPVTENGRIVGVQGVSRDISDRKKAEEALRQNEALYRTIIQLAPDSISTLDMNGVITSCNAAAARLIGCRKEEMLGKSFLELGILPEETQAGFAALFQSIIQERRFPAFQEAIFIRRDGSYRYAEVHIGALTEGDEITGLQLITRDVTERKRVEEALRASENQYRSLVEASLQGVVIASARESHVLYANPAAERILERNLQELRAFSTAQLFDAVHPEDRENLMLKFQERLEGKGSTALLEFRLIRPDGRERWVITFTNPVTFQGQEAFQVVILDITERKAAEEALRESEENFRAIAENASDGIFITAGKGVQVYANRRASEITGYSLEELVGSTIADLVDPVELPRLREAFRRRLAGEQFPAQYETVIRHKDGKAVPIELTASKTSWKGQVADIVIVRDVSERRQAEQALRESEEKYRNLVERANDGISIFQDEVLKFANPSMIRITGFGANEAIGKNIVSFLADDQVKMISDRYRRRMAGEDIPPVYESVLRHKDGHRIDIELNAGLITFAGRPADLVIVRDITERKKTEQLIRKNEERMRAILDAIPDLMFQISGDGTIVDYHATRIDDLAVGPDMFLNKNISDVLPGDVVHRMRQHIVEALRSDQLQVFEYRLTVPLPDGEPSDFEARIVPSGTDEILAIVRNVSERKKAEKALRESEEKFRALAEQSPNQIFIYKGDRILYVNRKCEEILGYTREEYMNPGFNLWAPVAPESVKQARESHDRNMKKLSVDQHDVTMLTKDGRKIEGLIHTRRIQFEGEEAVLGTITDITERKMMEAKLRESEERFRTIFENMVVGIYRTTPDGRILAANPALVRMLGFSSPDELRQHNLERWGFDTQHPRSLFKKQIEKDGEVNGLESVWMNKTGQKFIVRENARTVRDDQGNVVYYEGSVEDITARRKAEEALSRSEARYRAVVEDQTELITRFTKEGILSFVNGACCRFTDKKYDELIGQPFLPFISEKDRESVRRSISSIDVEHPIRFIEERIITPRGETRWMHWTNRGIFDPSGELVEYQAVGRDITERKEVHERLKASLEEKNVLLKELHHRVGNNLQVISSLLVLQGRELKDIEGRRILEECQKRVESMASVHKRLYSSHDLALIEFGQFIRDFAGELVRNADLNSGTVALHVEAEEIVLKLEMAVPCSMILNELISNTLKHAFPDGRKGEIRIIFRALGSGGLELLFGDNGVGLPENLDFRHATTLGLQLVVGLVNQLDGKIELEQRNGTSYRIVFPKEGVEKAKHGGNPKS